MNLYNIIISLYNLDLSKRMFACLLLCDIFIKEYRKLLSEMKKEMLGVTNAK